MKSSLRRKRSRHVQRVLLIAIMFQGVQRGWGRSSRRWHLWMGVFDNRGGEPWDGHQLCCLGSKLQPACICQWWWDCQAVGSRGELIPWQFLKLCQHIHEESIAGIVMVLYLPFMGTSDRKFSTRVIIVTHIRHSWVFGGVCSAPHTLKVAASETFSKGVDTHVWYFQNQSLDMSSLVGRGAAVGRILPRLLRLVYFTIMPVNLDVPDFTQIWRCQRSGNALGQV